MSDAQAADVDVLALLLDYNQRPNVIDDRTLIEALATDFVACRSALVEAMQDCTEYAAEVERLRAELALQRTIALMQAHRAFWLNHALTQAGHEFPKHLEDALIETFGGCWDDDGNIVRPLPEDKLGMEVHP